MHNTTLRIKQVCVYMTARSGTDFKLKIEFT